MRTRLLASVVLAAAVLSGCSHPDHGKVVGKHHEDAYTWYSQQCAYYDKNAMCRVYVPIPHSEPEHWVVTLTDGKDQWDINLDQQSWSGLLPGDNWPAVSAAR